MTKRTLLKRQEGFTLAEVVIAMALFMVIIGLVGKSFNSALHTSTVVSKSEESNIEGVVGLEMMRHDIQQAGFGLYTDYDTVPSFNEAAGGTLAAAYNDTVTGAPRAVVADDNLSVGDDTRVLTGTDYLALKATNLGTDKTSQKWTYLNYSSPAVVGTGGSKLWTKVEDRLSDGVDKVVVMRQSYKNGVLSRKLIADLADPTSWYITYRDDGAYTSTYKPPVSGLAYYYYDLGSSTPRAPFNRVDYVVKRVPQDLSKTCAPGAGTLYKTVMNQADGSMTEIPLLDCVADMQVVLGWNTSGIASNPVDSWSNANGSTYTGNPVSLSDAGSIRTMLKLVKVYILAQDGVYDRSFNNTATSFVVGEPDQTSLSKTVNLTQTNYQHYRWKLYRVVVKPPNLN